MNKKHFIYKYKLTRLIQLVKEALSLCEGRERDLLPRLPESTLLTLPTDIEQLEAFQSGRPAKIINIKGATAREKEVSIKGAQWVTAIRLTIKERAHNTGLERAVGVGSRFHHYRSSTVLTAIEAILNTYGENPELFNSYGIFDSDIQTGKEHFREILIARRNQELALNNKKNQTTLKNKVQERVQNAVVEIATAGYLQYIEKDRILAERFKALIASSKRKNSTEKEVEESFFSFSITAELPQEQSNQSTQENEQESESPQ